MSNILRNKNGNISKVKYFLPAYRTPTDESTTINASKAKNNHSISKKRSVVNPAHSQSVTSNGDISFEIVGIHENSQVQS